MYAGCSTPSLTRLYEKWVCQCSPEGIFDSRAIVGVCRAFIRFCREQSLFGAELLAIDGTKIAAVASRKRVITPAKIAKMNAAIDRKIAEYLASMDEADREEPKAASAQAD